MDAIELLTHDHAEVRRLTERFMSSEDTNEKAELAAEILTALKVHTTIEEEIFYPTVRDEVGDLADMLAEAYEEHHVVEQLIGEIEHLDPTAESWKPKFVVMTENVNHHVEEEEQELFPNVRKALDGRRLQALGSDMAHRKNELEYEQMTRDVLYALARERDLPVKSSMTKAEVIAVLVDPESPVSV